MNAPDGYSEKELLLQIAEGDETAFTRIFHQYHHQLGQHIFRLTESREMAEDITQDVFTKIWMIRESLAEVEHFRTWLYTISKNQALNALRQQARQRVRQQAFDATQPLAGDQELYDSVLLGIADQAIADLPPQQKKVYLLSRHEGMKYSEIAREMNISHETVKSYMKLALASITKSVREKAGLPGLLLLFSRIL